MTVFFFFRVMNLKGSIFSIEIIQHSSSFIQRSFTHQILIKYIDCIQQHVRIWGYEDRSSHWYRDLGKDRLDTLRSSLIHGITLGVGFSFKGWLIPVTLTLTLALYIEKFSESSWNIIIPTYKAIYISLSVFLDFRFLTT